MLTVSNASDATHLTYPAAVSPAHPIYMRHCVKAEVDVLVQEILITPELAPTTKEMKVVLKAARRIRHNAKKMAQSRYDDLSSTLALAVYAT